MNVRGVHDKEAASDSGVYIFYGFVWPFSFQGCLMLLRAVVAVELIMAWFPSDLGISTRVGHESEKWCLVS